MHHCVCRPHETKTFSSLAELLTNHTLPELLFLETKWASLMSYGSTSTCSASMTSWTRSCETASEFDPQNWWTKWGAILGVAQARKSNLSKGISEMAMSRLVPLLEFNRIPEWTGGGEGGVGKCSRHRTGPHAAAE